MKRWRLWPSLLVAALLAVLTVRWLLERDAPHWPWARAPSPTLALLVPDTQTLQHPVTRAWLDAAREEGLPLQPMTANRFVQAVARGDGPRGVLVPDTVHRHASDLWVAALTRHVATGGHVLLGFDAGLWPLAQAHVMAPISRLSSLVGCRYAPAPQDGQASSVVSPVWVSTEAATRLAIQPGKVDWDGQAHEDGWGELTTYGYPQLLYPHLRSEKACAGQVWMRSPDGEPVLSLHRHGQGSVLFANLPLGYLKTRTDGYLLHRLLAHFASEVLALPVLSAAPEGVGGLVLNLHVDSNAAEQPLLELERQGWFRQGPYAIHVTAGPDAFTLGDRLGLDMAHNPRMQALLRRLQAQGHELGNHGGWIHNVFGTQAQADNAEHFAPWLALNQQTLSAIAGQRLQSYSAPMGNHPDWTTDWLREHGFRAYYTAGDSGMGPTHSYQGGLPPAAGSPWAFPISNLERIATLDELPDQHWPESRMSAFIEALMRHVSGQGIVRLFYFHPASAPDFALSLHTLQDTARQLQADGRFRWYGMRALAEFLDRREALRWRLLPSDGDMAGLQADSPHSLQGMTWVWPKGSARGLHLHTGQAQIVEDHDRWRVIAGDVHHLELRWQRPTP